MSPRVAVLAGGISHERDVSRRSGRRVADALREAGCEVVVLDVDAGLIPSLRAEAPDVVWPVLHGAVGEDGSIRDVLELLGLPYVGTRPTACRRAWDKPVAAATVEQAGLAVPPGIALPHALFRDLGAPVVLEAALERFGLPLVVKPSRGGSALGMSIVREAGDLARAVVECFAYGETAVLQHFVAGTEVAVSVLDLDGSPRALPAVEIVADGGSYDYTARYTAGAVEFFSPARLDEATADRLARAAERAHEALGLRHLSRIDFIVGEDGTPWFLEANVAPGMTETSLLPQGAVAAGLDLEDLYRRVVDAALSPVVAGVADVTEVAAVAAS
ncbi:D-alanine-D-alanine ligase [Kineococcus xinjiangensis]|uniref:D-alanine--D-alanine ligase n=1 Tax=Kineococcus xinjiangensis TaxID=512762 RepID=A0A2S6IHZ7_9ACTN|nr:D-alanine--D-alanine ligase [Kineococcus xinjiangensis]PPK93843.1 D-alanine-D-alanine ligase [Kineococcus xinjiangensis]